MRKAPRTAARAVLLAGFLATLGAVPGPTQIALGPEFQVNVWTTYDQSAPSVAAGPAGDFVVAWHSYRQGMDGCSVYHGYCNGVIARRFDAAGHPSGGEIQVDGSLLVTQNYPAVAKVPGGGFVVAWDTNVNLFGPGNIWARRFDSEGVPLASSFLVNAPSSEDQIDAAVAVDAAGALAAVWHRWLIPGDEIPARRFDAEDVPVTPEFYVQETTFDGSSGPDIAMAPSGEFVVAWRKGEPGGLVRAVTRRFASDGQPLGDFVAASQSGAAGSPALAAVPGGGFIVAWDTRVGTDYDVFARRFDADGTPLGGEFRVNTYTTGRQSRPDIGADAAGTFLVTWASDGQDGSVWGIFARRFDAAGAPLGAEIQVNSYTTGYQTGAQVAATPDGDFLVVWSGADQDGSSWGVFGRMIWVAQFADGFEAGDTCAWSSAVGGGCP